MSAARSAAVAPASPCAATQPIPIGSGDNLSVAVIGSGIAGLSAAWLLSKPERDAALEAANDAAGTNAAPLGRVRLYERAASLGMDSDALDTDISHLDPATGRTVVTRVRLDMPLRVFTEAYYPHLTSLYDTVGVEYQPEDYSGSFSSFQAAPESTSLTAENASAALFFGYRNWLLGPWSFPVLLNPLWQSLRTPTSWRILRDLIRFHLHARRSLAQWERDLPTHPELHDITMREYLDEKVYSDDFVHKMLLPTLAGILTCTHGSVLAYPAHIVLSYWCKRSLGGVRRVCAGTQHVVHNLTQHVALSLGTSVTRITRLPSGKVRVYDSRGGENEFDHVVLACQANHAAKMLEETVSTELLQALKGIKYEQSRLVTHSDPALMPSDRAVWNSVNFILPSSSSSSTSSTSTVPDPSPRSISDEGMATIWLNRAQTSLRALGPSATPIFQSWNPLTGVTPKPELILHDATFERPVVTPHSVRCIETINASQGAGNIWFCGSYATPGMPLLETAVASAVRVARQLGQPCPWKEITDQTTTERKSEEDTTSTLSRRCSKARCTIGWLSIAVTVGAIAAIATGKMQINLNTRK